MKTITFAFLAYFLLSITTPAKAYYDKTVPYVELNRFMGDWYVQAGRFSFLEKDVFNGVESYTWNAKKNRIDIDFSYNQGSFTGPIKKAPQKGWVLDTNTNAWWKVSPLWPLKFDYLVIALADDYSWTAIGVPNEKYLWIMSREPHFPKDKTAEILKEIEGEGYDISNIVHVQHNPKP